MRVTAVNTAAAAVSDIKLKVGGSTVMSGVVRDLSYDLNKAVPLTTSYLGNGKKIMELFTRIKRGASKNVRN